MFTLVPLIWLLTVTVTASVQKIWDPSPKIGFIAAAKVIDSKAPALDQAAQAAGNDAAGLAAKKAYAVNRRQHSNAVIDTVVTGVFLALVAAIVGLSVREWILLLMSRKDPAKSRSRRRITSILR